MKFEKENILRVINNTTNKTFNRNSRDNLIFINKLFCVFSVVTFPSKVSEAVEKLIILMVVL